MKTYTVHMPTRAGGPQPDTAGAVFVREGFHFWAFLLPPLWLIVQRMWLVLIGYVVLVAALEGLGYLIGDLAPGVFLLLAQILFGLEAGTLKRWTLERKGHALVGIASGRTLREAEQRFFDGWAGARAQARHGGGAAAAPLRRPVGASGERPVAGLFPQPERPR